MKSKRIKRLTLLAMMVALDVILSPLFRIEGMAPMSSVLNVTAAVLMGPLYATIMALMTAILRMVLLGIPPLALTGALFGALFAGLGYKISGRLVARLVVKFLALASSVPYYRIPLWSGLQEVQTVYFGWFIPHDS